MKTRRSGKRHPLLLYRRSMERLWVPTFLLGAVLALIWGWARFSGTYLLEAQGDSLLFAGAVVALAFSLFAFLARAVAYVQVQTNYLRIVTPFLNLKVSYRRIRSVYPTSFQQLFPLKDAGWADRRFLEPFFPMTTVVVELSAYPLGRGLLRLFLPSQMLLTKPAGFVFLVPDWIEFSTELDSQIGAWQQIQGRQAVSGRSKRG